MKAIESIALALALAIGASCTPQVNDTINVIPEPQLVTLKKGSFDARGAQVIADKSLDARSAAYVNDFAGRLAAAAPEGGKGKIRFSMDSGLAPESYTLDVRSGSVNVKAADLNGFVYAIQTIKQLLPAEIWGGDANPDAVWSIPAMSIKDSPRFSYRGIHMDCSRHFFSIDEVYRYIDIAVAHKMNRLHWHLTDDQGWRIEIKKYPELAKVSAWRNGTMIGRDFSSNDGIRYGGYYTQEELRSVVEYAAARGVTIIPEIDLPGHMQAVLAAYPDLGCTGGPYDVWTIWGVSDDVLCAGKEKVYAFLEDVFTELMDIFPSEYIHIGGDECPKVRWHDCPDCQAKIAELGIRADGHFSAEDYLQSYVMNRMEKFLNDHGRSIIGWDEILEGNISQSATIMSWRGAAGGIKAAQSGRDAIMAPNSHMYIDYYQAKDTSKEPVGIGGFVPLNKVYSYEPHDPEMTDEQFTHILGVQANLWTEYIATPEHLEYMLLPRMSALSEVQWCQPERKDWKRFRTSLNELRKVFDAMGLNYAKHAFDGRLDAEMEALSK